MLLWSDVNLSKLNVSDDGLSVSFQLIDMYQGCVIAEVFCSDAFHFCFQNTFNDGEGLASYVGEVSCELIEGAAVRQLLSLMKFPFSNLDGSGFFSKENEVYWIRVEGGEVIVTIGCRTLFCTLWN